MSHWVFEYPTNTPNIDTVPTGTITITVKGGSHSVFVYNKSEKVPTLAMKSGPINDDGFFWHLKKWEGFYTIHHKAEYYKAWYYNTDKNI